MFASLTAKLIALAAALALLTGVMLWFGAHERAIGAAGVQAKWDAAKASQTVLAVNASESARATENRQIQDFAGIASGYLQATIHAYPSLADALPAAVAAGTVQLRDDCPATPGRGVPEGTARSRAADAAATQALADRVQAAISAVRAGDEADARERQLSAQVIGLQGVLAAERGGR